MYASYLYNLQPLFVVTFAEADAKINDLLYVACQD
jgi:hypothetical protein